MIITRTLNKIREIVIDKFFKYQEIKKLQMFKNIVYKYIRIDLNFFNNKFLLFDGRFTKILSMYFLSNEETQLSGIAEKIRFQITA